MNARKSLKINIKTFKPTRYVEKNHTIIKKYNPIIAYNLSLRIYINKDYSKEEIYEYN